MSLVIKSSKTVKTVKAVKIVNTIKPIKPIKAVKIALCIFNAIFCFIVFTDFIRIFYTV